MYPHVDDYHHWALPEVLEYQAQERPHTTFFSMVDGPSATYAEILEDTKRVAGHFASLGVGPGDRVAVLLPNSLDFVRVWTGLAWLGAVFVPLNTALMGDFLAHQIRSSTAKVAVCHERYLGVLDAIRPAIPRVETTVVCGADGTAAKHPDTVSFASWRDAPPHGGNQPGYRDLACIMYTSGTTGPSKGVLMPHAHCYLFAKGIIDIGHLRDVDRYYITMPFFHVNALFMQLYATLVVGASAVAREKFSGSSWVRDIRENGCTITNLIGMMSHSIIAQPPSELDSQHDLRLVVPAPNPAEHERAMRQRFGVPHVLSTYGMTEVNLPFWGRLEDPRPGTIGFGYDEYFDVRIVDSDTDDPVPAGEIGEIAVRPLVPFGFMAGYDGLSEKTVETWRNMWFHTGDAAWMDETGCVTFVDRMKDCIRRRGENISSFEVEACISDLDGVAEVAAFAVPSDDEGTEDEVMLAVVPTQGQELDPAWIHLEASKRLPAFAAPRFIEIVEDLPKTQTERLQKGKLRERGVTEATWDRDLHAFESV